MLRGRGTLISIILLFLVGLVVFLALTGRLRLPGKTTTVLPLDLEKIIPQGWEVIQDQRMSCDFDQDEEEEWLILYRYDETEVGEVVHSPIGGVIYDAQASPVPQELGGQSPYRPAFLVPYKLLPDFYAGKGQGYLGESEARVVLYQPTAGNNQCRAEELTVLGYSDGPLPTRLSIFRWAGKTVGYQGEHFVGNARVEANPFPDPTKRVSQVITYNRLQNHRSLLCERREYNRLDLPNAVQFQENLESYTIDFCFNSPRDPVYPEGVVLALLRGGAPGPSEQGNNSPTGETFLLGGAILPPVLGDAVVSGRALRVLEIANQGAVVLDPAEGEQCPPEKVLPGQATAWWCGRERAEVLTEIVLDGRPAQVVWHLISVASDRISADVHWRIESAELR